METMTDEGSCIRIKSVVSALKGAQQEDIQKMKSVIDEVAPVIDTYFEQAYELSKAAQDRSELKLSLEPNDDLNLGAFAFLPMEAPHDQINEEIFRYVISRVV